ncbi:Arf guanine nucleotide exchange factor sbh1 [Balamuthia mandrillaris]
MSSAVRIFSLSSLSCVYRRVFLTRSKKTTDWKRKRWLSWCPYSQCGWSHQVRPSLSFSFLALSPFVHFQSLSLSLSLSLRSLSPFVSSFLRFLSLSIFSSLASVFCRFAPSLLFLSFSFFLSSFSSHTDKQKKRRKSSAAPAGGAGAAPRAVRSSGSSAGILRFYTEDAEGLKVQPMAVIIFSFAYIGCVVLLHLWGKFIRG